MKVRLASKPILVIIGCSETVEGDVAALMDMVQSAIPQQISLWRRWGGGSFTLCRNAVELCCINRAAKLFPPDIVYSFHPECLVGQVVTVPEGVRPILASCNRQQGVAHYPLPRDKRRGSSALQAAWLALEEWGYSGLVFAGVALGSRSCFGSTADYSFFREHWPAFAEVHGERCRAMSGYTAELFGLPDAEWLGQMLEVA